MSETYTGPKPAVGDKIRPQDTDSNRPSGNDQQQPLPNEQRQNQPFSSDKTLDPENQQHQWNDTDPDAQVSAGVTQGHTEVQQDKQGRSAEATSRSATGQPEAEDSRNPSSDHNPRTQNA